MIGSLTFGKFINRRSLIHKIDPRVKLMLFTLIVALIFIEIGITGYLILVGFAIFVMVASRVPGIIFLHASIPIFIMGIFITILNIFLVKDGSVLFSMGSYPVYTQSFERSLQIFLRIILMVQFTTVLTATTKPIDIAVATSALLRPLKIIKLPVNEIGIMVSITLRFIPTLLDEAAVIVSAQSSRGVDFKKGQASEKAKAIVSLVVPLFVSALGKAEDLSNAMESRGYDPKAKRTKYRKLKVKYYDLLALFLITGTLILFILVLHLDNLSSFRYLDSYFELW